ncbi:hypothetical protein BLOT_011693 [Blomia tropicalis]|nr:hypothetical protein BLOT_011693 [Blomia tropicalis]
MSPLATAIIIILCSGLLYSSSFSVGLNARNGKIGKDVDMFFLVVAIYKLIAFISSFGLCLFISNEQLSRMYWTPSKHNKQKLVCPGSGY